MATNEMTGAEIVLKALTDQGVDTVFGYPGGAVLPIYDEIFQQEKVEHILVRHEQGAGHAASGYAHATGRVGVMMTSSGCLLLGRSAFCQWISRERLALIDAMVWDSIRAVVVPFLPVVDRRTYASRSPDTKTS